MKMKGVLLILWTTVSASLLFLVLFTLIAGWGSFWPFAVVYSLHLTLAILATVGAVLVHYRSIDALTTDMNAKVVASSIEERLQRIGYTAGSTDRRIDVMLDRNRNARIEVKETASGSELKVFPALTREGLGKLFPSIVVLPFGGAVALWMSYRSMQITGAFSENVLRPALTFLEDRKRTGGPEQPETGSMIIASLKKANRLATEAFMALHASHSDRNGSSL